jgi:hypothetical protein
MSPDQTPASSKRLDDDLQLITNIAYPLTLLLVGRAQVDRRLHIELELSVLSDQCTELQFGVKTRTISRYQVFG